MVRILLIVGVLLIVAICNCDGLTGNSPKDESLVPNDGNIAHFVYALESGWHLISGSSISAQNKRRNTIRHISVHNFNELTEESRKVFVEVFDTTTIILDSLLSDSFPRYFYDTTSIETIYAENSCSCTVQGRRIICEDSIPFPFLRDTLFTDASCSLTIRVGQNEYEASIVKTGWNADGRRIFSPKLGLVRLSSPWSKTLGASTWYDYRLNCFNGDSVVIDETSLTCSPNE